MVATQGTASSQHGACIDDRPREGLRLRIRGTERDGQILRINSPRCTFGGAPTCTVRLRSPGVRPVHCLIIHSDGQTTVRNLSPNNALNNAPFHESPLRVGDRLRLGAIEFEVLSYFESQASRQDGSRQRMQTNPPRQEQTNHGFLERIERLEQQLATYTGRNEDPDALIIEPPATATGFHQAIEQLTQQIADDRERRLIDQQAWEAEKQRLNVDLARSAEQLSVLASELAEQQQRQDETEQERRRVSDQLAELEEAQGRWIQEREAVDAEYRQAREDALQVQRQLEAELADRRARLSNLERDAEDRQQRQAEWEVIRDQLEADRNQLQQAIEEHAAQIELLRAQHEEERRKWTEEKTALESVLADKAAREERTGAETTSPQQVPLSQGGPQGVQEEWETVLAQAQTESTKLAEPHFDETASKAPHRAAEALARLGQAGIWRDEEDAAEPEESQPPSETPVNEMRNAPPFPMPQEANHAPPFPMPQEANHAPRDRASSDDGEESIEDYMSRLLRRVGGASDEAATNPISVGPNTRLPRDPIAAALPERTTECNADAVDNADAVEPEGEFVPRRQAPELSSNLAAMRVLANDTTRSAIAKHADRNWSNRAKKRGLTCLLVLVPVAIGTFLFAYQPIVLGLGITAVVLIFGYLGWQAWSFKKRLLARLTLEVPSCPDTERSRQLPPSQEREPEAGLAAVVPELD
ncbi:MAG: FHA domain-containing protein [Pirellulaceae bacterium]